MKSILLYTATAVATIAALWVMNSSYQDEINLYHDYCEQVRLWDEGERYGVSQYDRKGHPNYKNKECSQ